MNNPVRVIAHVDGSYRAKSAIGGIGIVMRYGESKREWSIPIPVRVMRKVTTGHRAELLAVIFAFKMLKRRTNIVIYTDSQSVVHCANNPTSRKNDTDLWQQFNIVSEPHAWTLKWVKGHIKVRDNERAHRLAHRAAKQLEQLR